MLYGAHVQRDPAAARVEIQELLTLYRDGRIRPHVSGRYPLADGGAAIAKIAARGALGNWSSFAVPQTVSEGGIAGLALSGTAWATVFLLVACYATAFVDRQILALLVEPVSRDLDITDTQFSLLTGLAFTFF